MIAESITHLFAALILAGLPRDGQDEIGVQPSRPSWATAMVGVHGRFRGRSGTFAHFGDSITESLAYWTPLKYARTNASPDLERSFKRVENYLLPECWRDWKGPNFGNQGGQTTEWADRNVASWLKNLDPEVVLIMFGTNDLREVTVEQYQARLGSLVRKCLNHGSVVILSTIPPRHGFEAKAAQFADAARQVSRELTVPLIDYHAEILNRRPNDWDGASEAFRGQEGYDVPTLIGRDGIHPSLPNRFRDDYSPGALQASGFGLRNYLAIMKYAEVIATLASEPVPLATKPAAPAQSRTLRDQARPLRFPAGEVLTVDSVEALREAVRRVRPGGTIVLANGVYRMNRTLVIATDGVTLRSRSGHPKDVVLDGGGTLGELLTIRACTGVIVAGLTVQNVRWNGIKIDSETGVQRLEVRGCVLRNIWQRGIKGTVVPAADYERLRPRDCRIVSSLFVNDRPKRFEDDPTDNPGSFDGNYVGGIDVMSAKGWTIADNMFVGIRGRTGGARGAVFLWVDSNECVIERNSIVDCDSGICLGNSFKPPDVVTHCSGIIVRNNFVTRAPENGILAAYSRDCAILHNTVHDPTGRPGRLIRIIDDNDGLQVENNLLSGPDSAVEETGRVRWRNNLSRDLTAGFVAPQRGDLRLTAAATAAMDGATRLPKVTTDIDGKFRGQRPDFGASEYETVTSQSPTLRRPER